MPSVQVAQQRDLGAVLDQLPVDVLDDVGEGELAVERARPAVAVPLQAGIVEPVQPGGGGPAG